MENLNDPDWLPNIPTPKTTQVETAQNHRCCILCKPQQKPGKQIFRNVSAFSQQQWAKVQETVAIRSKKPNFETSVYHCVALNLPEQPGEKDGYHSVCYKNFTACSSTASSTPSDDTNTVSNSPQLLSTASAEEQPSTSGIFPQKCLFCGNMKKRQKGSHEVLRAIETQSIQEAAMTLNDAQILAKFSGNDVVDKKVKCHQSCKSAYLMSAKRVKSTTKEILEVSTVSSPSAIHDIQAYVEESVLGNQRPELLTSVYARYLDFCGISSETPLSNAQSLMRNLSKKFGGRLKFQSPLGKKFGLIMYNSETADNAVRVAYDYASDDERIITKAALLLREHILNVPKKVLPENPTLDDLKEGDALPPPLLFIFFTRLYCGQSPQNCTQLAMRRVRSSCDDALFIAKKGKVKPAKQVALGVAIKSCTGSKKLVRVLNRLGHCINYNCLEELETETAEQLQERQLASPEGTVKGQPMGLAFDNFDELTNTLSGADTLHDTMGIMYQNIPKISEEARLVEPNTVLQLIVPSSKKGRKRSLQTEESLMVPYWKKPKMTAFSYRYTDVFNLPNVSAVAKNLDLVWMMSHALDVGMIPMWVGFNASKYQDNLPKQEVRYMPNLQHPITSLDVIQETLIIAQKCANECEQQYAVVSYDLNAAKPAMQIQATEKPKFDNVFVMPGTFHIEMAFFKAIGKIISDSGGPDMLTATDVLAPGSLNGFLSGKHFNRCKRLHPILALAFEILHFLAFLKTYEGKDRLEAFINDVANESITLEYVGESDVFNTATTAYAKYTDETRSGTHGSTAQFWMMYVDFIHLYHNLERATRTNDIDLYIYTLTSIIDLFFATNHLNYSRWLTKFQLDLMNLEESHPGLRKILEEGAFTVRRTEHAFSRVPVDLTLEQTVNADAASRLTGIISATNSYPARLRWMITKSTRASFISLVQEMAGLIEKNDVAAELRPARIRRDVADLKKVMKQIKDSCNPFDVNEETDSSKHKLFNINTGKATSQEICECLLKIPENGKVRHQDFLNSCLVDANRFEERIPKAKLKTFSDDSERNRKAEDKRIAELRGTRDLMGRLVILASKRNLDLPYIFEFPLIPVPLSMCSIDGTMAKTDKSALFKLLESKDQGGDTSPALIRGCIIDGQFLLHTLPPNLPSTYGGLARSILIQAVMLSKKEVHLIFDDYPQPSLKDTERGRRGIDEREFVINGPEQKRPKDIGKALKSRSFKTQLPKFLAREWQSQAYLHILGDCNLHLDIPGETYHYHVVNGILRHESDNGLKNNHEEADTKIVLHAKALDDDRKQGAIVIRASDTDIAVILLYHCNKFKSPLWMDVGISSKNNRRYISITNIYESLGPQICAALPGFHAFTGCDYTSSFVRKGKIKPFAKLQNNKVALKAFQSLAIEMQQSQQTQKTLKTFTAIIYGAKENTKLTLNEHRYKIFEKGYWHKSSSKNPLEKLKGIDASAIPPCEAELNMHMKRAAFVAQMWANADVSEIRQHPDASDGWDLENECYVPIWHEGPQVPDTLIPEQEEIINDDGNSEDVDMAVSSDDESDWTEDDAD